MNLRSLQWREIHLLPAAGWTLALIIAHQSIIASSSYFLTHLIETFQAGGDFSPFVIAYLAAMLLPYIPGCASLVTLQLWINQAHHRFSNRLAESTYGFIEKHRDDCLRESIESVYSRNSFIVLQDYLTFIHQFASFFLNSTMSMAVLSLLLPGNLILGYIASILGATALILLLRQRVYLQSTRVENAFISYSDTLSQIWDNSVLGNRYNFDLWKLHRDQVAAQYYSRSNRLQLLKQSGNLALASISLIPTVYLILSAIHRQDVEAALIAAIIVNLTRIFHILNSLSGLVYQVLDFTAMSARVQVLLDAELGFIEPTALPQAPFGKVLVNGSQVHQYQSVVEVIRNSNAGRFTIRGANGSGKSTLLHILKKALSTEAILMPSHHGKLKWRAITTTQSTGQRVVSQLLEVANQLEIKYLLLDEWDANLDLTNEHAIDELLQQLSENRVVIEIRH